MSDDPPNEAAERLNVKDRISLQKQTHEEDKDRIRARRQERIDTFVMCVASVCVLVLIIGMFWGPETARCQTAVTVIGSGATGYFVKGLRKS